MSLLVPFNGTNYLIPTTGETGWDQTVTNFLSDVGNNALTLATSQTVSNKLLKLQAGTAAAPSLTFASDTASGVYQPATSQLALATAGTQRLLIDASGNLTANGTATLGGVSTSGNVAAANVSATTLIKAAAGTASAPSVTFTADTATGVYQPSTSQIALTTAGSQRLLINASGAVTIGGTVATGALTVTGNASATGSLSAASATITNALTAGSASITNGVSSATISTTGNASVGGNLTVTGSYPSPALIRNYVHNPLFNIWQRGTSAFTSNGYTADRWSLTYVNGNTTVSQAALADADRSAIGDEAAIYGLQAAVTGTAGTGDYSLIAQPIESVRRLGNKTVTVSFWAKAASGTPKLGASLDQVFGSGGSPSSSVTGTGQTVTLSTSWTRYTLTFTLASTAGKTLGTNGNDATWLNFWFSAGSNFNTRSGSVGQQSATFQVWGIQLEVSSFATTLEKPDPQQDLAKCQRFFAATQWYVFTGSFTLFYTFPVPMRAAPTVTCSAAGFTAADITPNGALCYQTTAGIDTVNVSADL